MAPVKPSSSAQLAGQPAPLLHKVLRAQATHDYLAKGEAFGLPFCLGPIPGQGQYEYVAWVRAGILVSCRSEQTLPF